MTQVIGDRKLHEIQKQLQKLANWWREIGE
jgi:hypothetical protein